MRIVKWIFVVLATLAAVLVGGGYALSPKFTVVRSVTINAPADKVYPLVADPRGWKQWSVWNRRDPAMQVEYFGAPAGAGAGWSWKSKTQGDGRMSFTAAEPNRRLAYDLYFPDFGTTSKGDLTLAAEGHATKVTWTMDGDMGSNPLYRWFALNADSLVGKDFDAGLAGLKEVAEKP
ncbi:MAG: polyketide cyclase [Leptothrix sp. (in: Bacteria)]|nr:polyketide cyclase [Leptothrix sp. (in: b-proteobacteria)]